jgi:hypothetical protein
VFLGSAIVACALWLWLRPPLPPPEAIPVVRSAPPRPVPVDPKSIELEPAALERYVGKYEGRQSFVVELAMKNGHLFASSPGVMVPSEMLATSETDFFLKGMGVQLKFRVDAGVVKGFTASTEFGVLYMDRVP